MASWPKDGNGNYLDATAATQFVRQNGSSAVPPQPRSLVAQSGSRKMLVTWEFPEAGFEQIAGWKVYVDNENSLFSTINDPNVRQIEIPSSAGSSPPTRNVFVAAINKSGIESNPVQVQGNATTEAGAPTDPTPPAGSAASGDTGATGDDSSGFIQISTGGRKQFA